MGCSWDIGNKLTGPSFLSQASLRVEGAGRAGWQPICTIDEEGTGAREVAAVVGVLHVGTKVYLFLHTGEQKCIHNRLMACFKNGGGTK